MICKAIIFNDPLLSEAYNEGMKELNDFWGINWIESTPDIFVVDTRKEINEIRGTETSGELVGWSKGRDIHVLNYNNLEKESSLKLTRVQYKSLIKHELNHLFQRAITESAQVPLWLREGLSIYLSGQDSQWTMAETGKNNRIYRRRS